MTYKTIDLFCGIGGIRLGFQAHGCETVFSSDIDKTACKIYAANFGEVPYGNINQLWPYSIPNHDILLAGFPCQPFSIAGKGLGFADIRGTLFFNIVSILEAKKPKAFLLENVKRLVTHDGGNTLQVILTRLRQLGYKVEYKVLNSLYFGVPQRRERVYIVGLLQDVPFEFPKPLETYPPLSSILETDVDSSYLLSDVVKVKLQQNLKNTPDYPSIWHTNQSGHVHAHPYSCALTAQPSYNAITVNGERRLTPRELLRLQGFPEDFKADVPYTLLRKAVGNSVSVPVIQAIAGQLTNSLNSFNHAT